MVEIERISFLSGKKTTMNLPITKEEFDDGINKWGNGMHIQNAFPMLTQEQREFIMTGVTPDEWENAFGYGFE